MDWIDKLLKENEHIPRKELRLLGFKRISQYEYRLVLDWGSGCELVYETQGGDMYLEQTEPKDNSRKWIYLRDTKDLKDFKMLVTILKGNYLNP